MCACVHVHVCVRVCVCVTRGGNVCELEVLYNPTWELTMRLVSHGVWLRERSWCVCAGDSVATGVCVNVLVCSWVLNNQSLNSARDCSGLYCELKIS